MRKIDFYSFALSPFALKVHCYLLFLNVDFDTIFVDPVKMRNVLPIGKTIPVLTINNESRNESSDLGYWLNELYPEKKLVPAQLAEKIQSTEKWVSDRLINLAFRDTTGFDDSLIIKARKRLHLSKILDQTVPDGISCLFRFLHMMLLDQTFVKHHVAMTDKTRSLPDLQSELATEFEALLEGGPFLNGSQTPTMSDLSAYPQIVKTKIVDGGEYFLPGEVIQDWVAAMENAVPNLQYCFAEQIKA